jgi:thiazole synthase
MELFHCFGAKPEHRVSAEVAVRMLHASKCRYLAVNTHAIDSVTRGEDLPVGYADATLGSVSALLGLSAEVTPVLNINHPLTAQEAVSRARRAVDLTGIRVIKLEVLDSSLKKSADAAVVEAARQLIGDGLEVWPLVSADAQAYRACTALGATMVRVMGSPIGAMRGIDEDAAPAIAEILDNKDVPVMLDGGIGSAADLTKAQDMGFDAALVNSCLFASGTDPVAALAALRTALEDTAAEPRNAVRA